MTHRFERVLAASLLASTAMVPAAMAQNVAVDGACAELEAIVLEYEDTFQQGWIDEATVVVEDANAQECAAYVQQANLALEQDVETAQADRQEGRIVIDQPPPTVMVEEDAPEVAVTQPDPQVTVQQARPEIIVQQQQPTVSIEIPEPIVTIDQPQPNIIVRMPQPDVSVAQAQPRVQVEQDRPEVAVQQAEPQIDVETSQPEGEADVSVQQGQAQVQIEEGGQADVAIEEAQPQVMFESAEPRVEFQAPEQPQVRFTESGEPNVVFEEMDEEQTQAAIEEQQGLQAEQESNILAEQDTAAWMGEREAWQAPNVQMEGFQEAQADLLSLDNLMDAEVYGANDEDIGNVEDVVLADNGEIEYIVVDVGGFLGMGSRQVALGLNEVTVLRDEGFNEVRVYVSATEEQLENAPEWDPELQ